MFKLIIIFIFIILLFYMLNGRIEKFDNKNITITVVSGFWDVKNKYSKDSSKYLEWFNNSLKINENYVFYCNPKDKELIQKYRGGLSTTYIDYTLDDFYTNKYHKDTWIHKKHIPSKELSKIWLEKINMIKLTKDNIEPKTDFYIWIDAGICTFRDKKPPSTGFNQKCLKTLPKDTLSYSFVDEDYHNFAAGVIIIPINIVDNIHKLFYKKLSECEDGWRCGSEQFILTKILEENSYLFNKLTEGYGKNLEYLFDC